MSEHTADDATGRPTEDGPLIVFGYGSLMWMPNFEPASMRPALAIGWHRRFSLMSMQAWGTDAAPGLCAALHPGGSAWGRALSVRDSERGPVLAALQIREAAYRERTVNVVVQEPAGPMRRRALTFVADNAHPRMRANLAPDEAMRLVRQGRGIKGSALDYVRRTVDALGADGHSDSDAHRFLAMIESGSL